MLGNWLIRDNRKGQAGGRVGGQGATVLQVSQAEIYRAAIHLTVPTDALEETMQAVSFYCTPLPLVLLADHVFI